MAHPELLFTLELIILVELGKSNIDEPEQDFCLAGLLRLEQELIRQDKKTMIIISLRTHAYITVYLGMEAVECNTTKVARELYEKLLELKSI